VFTPVTRADDPLDARRRGLVVLAAVVLLAINLRAAVTGLSPLLPRVTLDTGLSSAEVGLVGALPPFCFAAAALLGPVLLRRAAAEHLVLLSLGLAVAGQLGRPWAPGPEGFLVSSVVALLGMGTGNVVLPVLVKAYFPRRIGQVTAIYVTSLTLGTALPPLVAVPLADVVAGRTGSATTGWQFSLAAWGATAALAMLPWLRPAAHPCAVPPPRPPHRSVGAVAHRARKTGAMAHSARGDGVRGDGVRGGGARDEAAHGRLPVYRSRVAWGVMLVFGANSLNTYALFAWLPVRLVEAGLPESTAGQALSLFAGLGVPSSLVVPVLAARFRRQFPLVAVFAACYAGGLFGLLVAPTRATMLWTLIAGLGGSGFPLALTLIGLRTRTPASAGALSGFVQGLGYLGAGLGPLAVGALRQATGGWAAPFGVLWATMILLLLGGLLAGRPRTVEDDLGAGAGAGAGGEGETGGSR
jgi:CP family cyanate transporter-like MFS transporter